MRYWQQGTVHQPQLTYFKVLLLMTLVEDGPRKRHWIIIILWRKILRLSLFIRCQSQCNYHKYTHTFVGILSIFGYAKLFFQFRISRSKSKDFARGRSGGSVSSRVNKNNDCDIDGMTFENMFEDLLASTSKIGIEDG